jgi:hypothetical protein
MHHCDENVKDSACVELLAWRFRTEPELPNACKQFV